MNDNKSSRFLAWLRGEYSYFSSKSEAVETYHNKTIAERVRDWQGLHGESSFNIMYNIIAAVICISIIGVLMATVFFLPPFGAPDNPVNNEVSEKYIIDGIGDTGAVNVVAGMILDYRAFDTLGESTVLFVAVCAVVLLLRNDGKRDEFDALLHEMEEPRHDVILKTMAVILVPMIMIFGVYVVVNGHLSPGGGFSGGAIIGAALILFASAFGTKAARKFFRFSTYKRIVFVCLMFYAVVKGVVFFTAANGIDINIPLGTPGNLFSAGLIFPLNICVGLIVAGTMYVIYVLFSKGEML